MQHVVQSNWSKLTFSIKCDRSYVTCSIDHVLTTFGCNLTKGNYRWRLQSTFMRLKTTNDLHSFKHLQTTTLNLSVFFDMIIHYLIGQLEGQSN